MGKIISVSAAERLSLGKGKQANKMKTPSKNASPLSNRARELRAELARKIASFMGSEENRATDIPGVTLHRRIARGRMLGSPHARRSIPRVGQQSAKRYLIVLRTLELWVERVRV